MTIVERAKELASRAHAGQVDKAGRPYIEHCARVAEAVREDRLCNNEDCNGFGEIVHWNSVGCSDPSCCSPATSPCPTCDEAEAVAWLHDVYEDCDGLFCRELDEFPIRIVAACMRLCRGVYPDYYAAIKEQDIAVRVKLADIADNADEGRLQKLDLGTANRLRAKYASAKALLTVISDKR